MSFVLDTDICSAFIKGNAQVFARSVQFGGSMVISTITTAELCTWRSRSHASPKRMAAIDELLALIPAIPVDDAIASTAGRLRGELFDRGITLAMPDALIAATALAQDFTLITHNSKDFISVPGLRLADWMS